LIQGETITSHSKLTSMKWYHIAIVKNKKEIKLYINGILDQELVLKYTPEANQSNLYLGGVPWLKDQCNYPFLIDEVRYYNIAIEEDYIQAEASPILGNIQPSYIKLGCINCHLKEAMNNCKNDYHICTSVELHTGGYQIARNLGWLQWNTHIWTHSAYKHMRKFDSLKGLAICCSDLK